MTLFAERLREIRTENKLKQEDLAKILSVNQRTISNWENSVNEPDFDMLSKIAKYFEVSADYLLGLEE